MESWLRPIPLERTYVIHSIKVFLSNKKGSSCRGCIPLEKNVISKKENEMPDSSSPLTPNILVVIYASKFILTAGVLNCI